jgi:hypothetical protein
MPYKLLTGSHTTHGKTYRAGNLDQNIIDDGILTDKEIELLEGRLEKVGAVNKEEVTTKSPTNKPSPDDITIEELLSKNVPDIEAEIATIIDVALLDSIKQEEIKGKGRAGVFKAIEARKLELRG